MILCYPFDEQFLEPATSFATLHTFTYTGPHLFTGDKTGREEGHPVQHNIQDGLLQHPSAGVLWHTVWTGEHPDLQCGVPHHAQGHIHPGVPHRVQNCLCGKIQDRAPEQMLHCSPKEMQGAKILQRILSTREVPHCRGALLPPCRGLQWIPHHILSCSAGTGASTGVQGGAAR